MAQRAKMVDWAEWVKVPDYLDPKMPARVAALREKAAVQDAAGPGKGSAGSSSL